MNKRLNIKYFIATDKYNLLKENESKFYYFVKKVYYNIYLRLTNQFEPIMEINQMIQESVFGHIVMIIIIILGTYFIDIIINWIKQNYK